MRLLFRYGLPVLRRDFRLRRILAVRIWLYLLFLIGCVIGSREEHLCLVHVFSDPSDVLFLVWTKWTLGLLRLSSIRFWLLRWSSFVILCFVVWVFIRFLVSEVDHGLRCGYPPDLWFLIWISCSLLTSFGIHRSFVSEVDLDCVVVRTFSCWSDFNMRASVKHELLGHGFHDELFN